MVAVAPWWASTVLNDKCVLSAAARDTLPLHSRHAADRDCSVHRDSFLGDSHEHWGWRSAAVSRSGLVCSVHARVCARSAVGLACSGILKNNQGSSAHAHGCSFLPAARAGGPISFAYGMRTRHASAMGDDHKHDHEHPDHSQLGEMQARVRALESILTEKGYVDRSTLDLIVDTYETKVGPRNGARIVARSWTDPEFKARLLSDATAAANSLGFPNPVGAHLIAVENTPQTHNLVVCTLCSCYPWEVLGLPPVWYKSAPYRSRAVIEPRAVLAEFGVELPENTRIRVWDSTAETRFLVLPMRPPGTEGWSEQRLADLVTRDSMIGAGLVRGP